MKRYLTAFVPLLVLLATTVLASLVAYGVIQATDSPLPLRKLISKTTQVFLLLSLFPLMAYLKMDKTDLGFAPWAVFFKQLLKGFGLGFITLLPVFGVLIGLGVQVVDSSQPWTFAWLLEKSLVSLLLALLIAWLEEPLFRGLILVGLARHLSTHTAILLSAGYYAALHFIDSKTEINPHTANVWDICQLVSSAYANLLTPAVFPALLALCLVGIFLGLLKTRQPVSLGLCIGCHTAWVWQIKLCKSFFNNNPDSTYAYLVSTYDGVIGYLVACWLAFIISCYLLMPYFLNKKPSTVR